MNTNKRLFPIKAHFFFFMAASGPILPYLTVYGKQLGISEVLMGTITAIVPITFLLAKPVFGFIADYFYDKRKLIFITLILSMAVFYTSLYFIPPLNIELQYVKSQTNESHLTFCDNATLSYKGNYTEGRIKCSVTCITSGCRLEGVGNNKSFCYQLVEPRECNFTQIPGECLDNCLLSLADGTHLFKSFEFYAFIALMTLAMISFNVSNSISDAICFDMLGEGGEKTYGYQRVWGTVGFGVTAFLGGVGMDLWSGGNVKNYKPAFILVVFFTVIDMIFCTKLKLPNMSMSENILKDLSKVLKNKAISVFLMFATLVGTLDGFLIYFMFWFLEDLAIGTDQIRHIKVLEGLTVAAETLGGEIIFFILSGKIIKIMGYGHTLSLCFLNYALRLGLISFISNPWWILPVELLMQGPTYALCYKQSSLMPTPYLHPGLRLLCRALWLVWMMASVSICYAVGSLIGGFLYKTVGGRLAFRIFSFFSLLCCFAHIAFHKLLLRKSYENCEKKDYIPPGETLQMVQTNKKRNSQNC